MKGKREVVTRKPLVSVVMPVYNAGGFLVPAIKSILNQTYKKFELIMVDDNSTDGSFELAKKYQKRYFKKIKLIQTKRNLNCGGDMCANEGMKLARGKYIARMDADDVAHPQRLKKQVEFLEENKDVFLVGSDAYVIDKEGTLIGEKLEPQTNQEIYQEYFTIHPIIHPTAMYRRRIGGKRFFYEIKYRANNDYYTFFKLICKNVKFFNLKEKLLFYRIHGKNDTFVNVKQKFLNTLRTRLNMALKYGYNPTLKQVLITILQAVVILTLPQSLTTRLYLLAKGIIKIENPIKYLISSLKTRASFRSA